MYVSPHVVFDEASSWWSSDNIVLPENEIEDSGVKEGDSAPESPKPQSSSSPWKTGVLEAPTQPTDVNMPAEGTVIDNETSLRRSLRPRKLNPQYTDVNCIDTVIHCCFSLEEEPSTYEEAKGIPEWENAMKEEMAALKKNKTWELVSPECNQFHANGCTK